MTNTLATLNGLFKEVYANKIRDLLPNGVKLQKAISFVPKEKELGKAYNQPVILAHEHGVTFSNSGDAFYLNRAVAGQTENARLTGVELVLRSAISYQAASRAANGRNAFIDATEQVVQNMRASIAKKLEIEVLYGQVGLGTVESVAGQVITIAAAEWAPGIWAGAENMYINITNSTGATTRNGGENYGIGADGYKISAVDIGAKKITVVGTMTGVVAGDVIWFAGSKGKEMAGIHKIMSNSGSLFGIDASVYSMWKGNTYTVTGTNKALTFNVISAAIELAVAKGLTEDVTLYISTKGFSDLQADNETKRAVDYTYSTDKVTRGSNEFAFFSQNGKVKIVPSLYVKEGYAYAVVESDFKRIGSTDITFNRPGSSADSFFMDLPEQAGYELRAYTDQAVFCEAPSRQVLISGIVSA